MSDQLTDILLLSLIVILFLVFWALSIALVYVDLLRRKLSGKEMVAWLGLVALLPVIGVAAYLFARMLVRFFSPGMRGSNVPDEHVKRVTLMKQEPGKGSYRATIPAVELMRQTVAEATPKDIGKEEVSEREIHKITLAVMEGPHGGEAFVISNLPALIGRGKEASVRLDGDHGVSRKHAEIYLKADTVRIRDLQSTHGTHVNGYSVNDKQLDPGDKIMVGVSQLLVESVEMKKNA